MICNDFPWHKSWWNTVVSGLDRRPSALLLVGPKGTAKNEFARDLAASWLCNAPLPDRSACGRCDSCRWISGGSHPDFRWVRPDAEREDDELEGEAAGAAETEGGAEEDTKKKSQQIRIEQIRGLSGFANVGSHRGGLRVVLISPANRMNYEAANALLKTLEEPPPALVFILVADTTRGIPATIVSRCRRINVAVDDITLARVHTEQSEAAPWLLPLLMSGDIDPIKWAEKAGKSPPGDALELMMRWMNDAARVRLGLAPRSFPEHEPALRDQSLRIRSAQNWSQTLAELQKIRGVAEHPLNPKLFYESIFDRYCRALV